MKTTTLISILHIVIGITCCIFVVVVSAGHDGEYATHQPLLPGRFVYAVVASAGVAFALSGFAAYGTHCYGARHALMFASLFVAFTIFAVPGIWIAGQLMTVVVWLVISAVIFGSSYLGGTLGTRFAGKNRAAIKKTEKR